MGPRSPIDPISSIPEDAYTAIVISVDPELDILKCTMVMPPVTEKGVCSTADGLSAATPSNWMGAASGDVVGATVVADVAAGVADEVEVPLHPADMTVKQAPEIATTICTRSGKPQKRRHRFRGLTRPPWDTSLT